MLSYYLEKTTALWDRESEKLSWNPERKEHNMPNENNCDLPPFWFFEQIGRGKTLDQVIEQEYLEALEASENEFDKRGEPKELQTLSWGNLYGRSDD